MKKNHKFICALFTAAILAGCSGGGGGSVANGNNLPPSGNSNPGHSGIATGLARVRFGFVLARAIPGIVNEIRFTGLGSDGRVLYGPVVRPKSGLIEMESVPVTVTKFRVEYLSSGTIIGLSNLDVTLSDGQIVTIQDPNFIDVTALVDRITVSPGAVSIAKGRNRALSARADLTDGSGQDVTGSVTWSSSNSEIATVSAAGIVTGRQVGSAQIEAALGNVRGLVNIQVTVAEIDSLELLPQSASLVVQSQRQFGASAHFSDATEVNVTALASWTSSNTSAATVSSTGLALAVTPGRSEIRVQYAGATNTSTLDTLAAPLRLTSLRVEPSVALSAPDTERQLRAIGRYEDGSELDLTREVSWLSSNSAVATVSNSNQREGLVSIVGQGLGVGVTVNATHPSLAEPAACRLAVNRLLLVSHQIGGIAVLRSDLPNGHLTLLSSPGGNSSKSLILDPAGRFLYAPFQNLNGLSTFELDGTTGSLSAVPNSFVTTGTMPLGGALDPGQKHLYVANGASQGTLGISPYEVNPTTGRATAIGNGPVDPTRRINAVAVHPSGNHLFALYSDPLGVAPSGIRIYVLDRQSGLPSFLRQTDTGGTPLKVAYSSDGRHLYCVDYSGNRLLAFQFDAATGDLTPVAGGVYPTSSSESAFSLAVYPGGNFVYLGSSVAIDVFSRDGSTGALAHQGSFPTGAVCSSISIDPTGRFLHATSESDFPVLSDDVTSYLIDTQTGLLSQLQQVDSGNQPTGSVVTP